MVLQTVAEVRQHIERARSHGKTIAAVPTMGALHEGHLSLVRAGRARAEEVVVTIFVNPTQFGPNEDFARYPRDLREDTRLAEGAGATIVFAPEVREMYPSGETTRVRVDQITEGLCGQSRPDHFQGVATVVAKLFNVIGSATYLFGRKDYQQFKVVERLARDLLFPVEIVGCPTVREQDGLALSSRNRYLDSEQRSLARFVPRSLQAALSAYKRGERGRQELLDISREVLLRSQGRLDYLELRDAEDLSPSPEKLSTPSLLALAIFIGETRLIDNVILQEDVPDLPMGGATDEF